MANAQLNVSFITNRKGGQNITYNDYIYRQICKNDDRTFWRCSVWLSRFPFNNIPVGFGRQVHTNPTDHTGIVTKQIFKEIQNSNDINRIQREAGGTVRPRAKKYLNIDRRLAIMKERFQNRMTDLMTCADSASRLLHLG